MVIGNNIHTLSAGLLRLVDALDDTDGNGLPHVTDGETTERRVLVVRLNALSRNTTMSTNVKRRRR